MSNQETNMDETTLAELLKDIFEHNQQTEHFMILLKEQLEERDKIIAGYKEQTENLVNSFEMKFNSIKDAPKPDLTSVNQILNAGLQVISQTIEKGPRPINRLFRLTLFPEQVRNPDYYAVMLTRIILGVLGLVVIILGYFLLNKMVK